MPPLANYQEVAVEQARRVLKDTGGVFIADVVGLGKTFIGLALLKHWNIQESAYGVVICPASLVPMWEAYIARYRIWATVLSMGALGQKGNFRLLLEDPKFSNAGVVLIDESHNFRGRDSLRYQALELFTADRPTILLTATPRNTSAWDIYHQIKLWHADDRTKLLDPPNPPNLTEFFRRVEPRNDSPPTASIRDLLDRVLIRRTRRHVLTVYGEDDGSGRRFIRINGAAKYFPDRELDTVSYNIEHTYGTQVYAALRDRMNELQYARYNLYPFVLPQHRDSGAYKNLQKAAATLWGLMRVMLFKRFESSVAAFRGTVIRMCGTHEWFLKALEQGFIPAGDAAQSILYGSDRDDQVEFADVEDELREASRGYHLEHFDGQALYDGIAADLKLLRDLVRLVEPITPLLDDKLVVLQEMLRYGRNPHEENRHLPGHLPTGKVLIFTQFADTATYLYDNLKDIVGEKLIRKVDSGTTDLLEVVARFAPEANPTVKTSGVDLRVLVATDVLSEGLNMQDGDHIINYDLHWNPVRLIQRVGRIDRLGSPHECVQVYNFLPEAGVERELGLQQRLNKRAQEIHDMIGEDAYILSRSEQLNEEAMYAIYKGDTRILDADEDATSLAFNLLEAEEIIRQLQQNDPEYFAYIQSLPNGVRTGAAMGIVPTIYVLCEAHDSSGSTQYRRMYLLDKDGQLLTSDVGEVVRHIQCDPHVQRAPLPANYNAVLTRVQQEFEQEVLLRQSELTHSSGKSGLGRTFALQQLQTIYAKAKDSDMQQITSYLTQLYTSAVLPRRAHNELNALRAQGLKGGALLEQLKRIARDYGLSSPSAYAEEMDEILTVRVVCSEALI